MLGITTGRRLHARGPAALPFLLSLTLLTFVHCAAAAEAETDEPVLVTATRQPYTATKAPFAAEVYTRADLERSGAANLLDFLASETSLNVLPGFGNPNQRLIDLRGFGLENGYQNVVIQLDGYRLNDIDQRSQFLGGVALQSVERVEIVKGAGSVTAGDGASAGVINIVTREYSGASAEVAAGNHGQRIARLALGHAGERWSGSLEANHDERDGFAEPDRRGLRDDQRLNAVSGRLRFRPTGALEFRTGFRHYDSLGVYREPIERQFIRSRPTANEGDQGFYSRQNLDGLALSAGMTAHFAKNWTASYDMTSEDKGEVFENAFTPQPFGQAAFSAYSYRSQRAQVGWAEGGFAVDAGYERFEGERRLDFFGRRDVSRDSDAAFLRSVIRSGNSRFTLGIRRDWVSFFKSDLGGQSGKDTGFNSWELGWSRDVLPNWTAFASYARAGLTQDIDRAYVFTGAVPGDPPRINPLVRPSQSDTVTVGANYLAESTRASFSVFYAQVEDEIYARVFPVFFGGTPFNTAVNTNLDRTTKYGAEVSLQQMLSESVRARLLYNYTRARIDSASAFFCPASDCGADTTLQALRDRDLPGVPRHGITAGLEWRPASQWILNLTQIYRSGAVSISDVENTGLRQRPYRLTNAQVRYRYDSVWQAFFAVDNLFEERNALYVQSPDATTFGTYAYPADYTRLWRFGVRADF
jgi:iron complex outermembrane receptor protein